MEPKSFTYLSKLLSPSLVPNSATLSQKALSILKLGQFFPVRTNLISQVFINRHPTSLTPVAGQFFHLFIPRSYRQYISTVSSRIDGSVLHVLYDNFFLSIKLDHLTSNNIYKNPILIKERFLLRFMPCVKIVISPKNIIFNLSIKETLVLITWNEMKFIGIGSKEQDECSIL